MSTDLKKGSWSLEEDQKLITYINRYGIWNWSQMPRFAGLSRTGKSCRLRWMNYLKPNVKKGNFSKEEEEIILVSRSQLGNKWSAIASRLPGRSDNDVKNHWHSHLKKRASEQNLVCGTTAKNNVNSLLTIENKNIKDIQQPANNHVNDFFESQFSFEEHNFTSSCTATTEDQQFEHISDYHGSPGTIDDLQYFWDQLCPLENLEHINDHMDHVTSAHAFEDSNDSFFNNDNNSSIFYCPN